MSGSNSDLASKISDAIGIVVVSSILLVSFATLAFLAFFSWIVLSITPQEDLPRSYQGSFVVNIDNYKNWHTYSRLYNSKTKDVMFDGDFVIRAIGKVEKYCEDITNCENYESSFYRVDHNNTDIYAIRKQDDKLLSQYVKTLNIAIAQHNDSIKTFSDNFSLIKPDFPEIHTLSIDYDGNEKVSHKAKKQCLNNGKGCGVRLTGKFSAFGLPSIYITAS
ncbi:MAG: hypothetical protein ACJA0T_000967 [Colwellia sp.]|jgi:hypothetical protein